ncbi:MAG: GNAT family N-acetyltransferase [Candidatus Bipolaricaulota bacterium]|nr:MAG: GNAT family N-acetyltransferase [Candidatus Bipolaricaulota bacterium]
MTLVPATVETVRDELRDLPRFFRRLEVLPAPDWPPAALLDALPLMLRALEEAPWTAGWHAWYWVSRNDRHLVGSGGFKGEPQGDGTVEIGYATRTCCRRLGFAREAMSALVAWALREPSVVRIVAETEKANAASRGLLRSLGFATIASAPRRRGMLWYERRG